MEQKTINFYNNKNVIIDEAFSALRTNIEFCEAEGRIKKLAVIGYNQAEGRTSVSINLAISYAAAGQKVLLVDTDMRKPIEIKKHGSEIHLGLSSLLFDDYEIVDVVKKTNIENLYYVPSGQRYLNPISYLSGNAFARFLGRVEKDYDMIILDTPAMGSVVDATVIASKADGAVLVISAGFKKAQRLKKSLEQLSKASINILGIVFNKAKKKEYRKYFDLYRYYIEKRKDKLRWGAKSENSFSRS